MMLRTTPRLVDQSGAQFAPTTTRPTIFGPRREMNASYTDRIDRQLAIIQRELQHFPGFADSVELQTSWRTGIDPNFYERRRDERAYLERERRGMWEEVDWFLYYYCQHFQNVVENENNNWDFYNGFQWDPEELKRMQQARLIPHVSNYMSRWARTLIGEERGAETLYQYVPNDESFKDIADLYTQVVGKICLQNRWSSRSSSGFANLAVGGRAAASVRPDPFDPYRRVSLENERPQEFLYDFENAKDGSLHGCSYLARVYYKDLEELIFQYPEWEDYLRTYNFGNFAGYENMLTFTVSQPKVAPTAAKRIVEVPQTFIRRPFYRNRRIAWVTEFYRRGGLKQWVVRDGNYNIDHDFPLDAPDQAVWFYKNLRDAYQAKQIALTGRPGINLVVEPQIVTRQIVDQEIWCGDVLLELKTSRTGEFPYVVVHNEFHNGEWRGFFQDDKSNQQLRNRMLVYKDMMLGGVKGKTFYHEDLFPKGSTSTQQEQWARDPNKIIIGNWNKGDNPNNLHVRIDPPNYGTLPQVLSDDADRASAFGNGGLNLIGDAEFPGQSDRLRRGLQESAQTGTVPLIKDWADFEERFGQQVAYRASFLHPTILLEYANAKSRERFLPILQQQSHSIDLDSITMQAVEVMGGPVKRNQQVAIMTEMGAQDGTLNRAVAPIILRLKDLPNEILDEIKENIAAEQQADADQRAHEIRMAEMEFEMKRDMNERKMAVEETIAESKLHPPIQTSIVMKANAPGAEAMAEIYHQHGIDADPDGVYASEVLQDAKDQRRDDVRQVHFNALDLPYQRDLSKLYPKTGGGKKPGGKKQGGGPRSAKDTSARSRKGAEKPRTRV